MKNEHVAFEGWVKSRGGNVMKDSSGRYISSMTRLWWECWEAATKHAEDAYVESAISHGWDAQEVEHVMRAADMRAALESLTGRNP